jgi:hypothetical protein
MVARSLTLQIDVVEPNVVSAYLPACCSWCSFCLCDMWSSSWGTLAWCKTQPCCSAWVSAHLPSYHVVPAETRMGWPASVLSGRVLRFDFDRKTPFSSFVSGDSSVRGVLSALLCNSSLLLRFASPETKTATLPFSYKSCWYNSSVWFIDVNVLLLDL